MPYAADTDNATIHSSLAAKTALEAPSDQSLRVPCYCEENIWRLAYRKLQGNDAESNDYFVVFITNPLKCVPMFHQQAVTDPTKPVYWDYHVILIGRSREDSTAAVAYDLDSHLPFPCPLETYLEETFSSGIDWPAQYLPYFRIVDSEVFLENFGSDRSHMLNPLTRQWNAKPPTYPCILVSRDSNMGHYMTIDSEAIERRASISADEKHPFGVIMSLSELRGRFHQVGV